MKSIMTKFSLEITAAEDGKVRIEGIEYYSQTGGFLTFGQTVNPEEILAKAELCLRSLDTDDLFPKEE